MKDTTVSRATFPTCFFFSLRVTRLFPKEASFCVPPHPLTLFFTNKTRFFLSWRHHLCVCCMFKGGFIKTRVVTKTFWLLCFLLLSVLPNCEPWYIDFFYTLEPTRRVCFCTRGYMCCNKVRTHLLHPPSLFFYACAVLRLWSHKSRDHSRLYIIHGKKAPSLSHPKLLPPFCHLFQIAFRSQNWLRFGCVCLYDQTIWICLTVSSVSCGCCSFDRSWFTHQNSLYQQKKPQSREIPSVDEVGPDITYTHTHLVMFISFIPSNCLDLKLFITLFLSSLWTCVCSLIALPVLSIWIDLANERFKCHLHHHTDTLWYKPTMLL